MSESNEDRRKAARAKWREQNREKKREADRAYREQNREKINEKARDRKRVYTGASLEYRRQYAEDHREEMRIYQRSRRYRLRMDLLSLLGGKCVKCGYSDWRALQIDHVNGGGHKERKSIKSLTKYYENMIKLISEGCVEYQVLCANCNQIKKHENGEHRR